MYRLSDVLLLILIATIGDCNDFSEIRDFGLDKLDLLREEFGLELSNGIPSEDTLGRVMQRLKPTELEKAMLSCYRDILADLANRHLRIDGKELRGTVPAGKKHALVQQVNVWLGEEKLCFGQIKVAQKSNEITAIPALLEVIDCKDALISMDAIGCQKEIVETIMGKEADYLIALKSNQKGLYEQVHDHMQAWKGQLPCYRELNKEHGRAEERKVYVSQQLELLEETQQWAGLRSLALVETRRIENGKQTIGSKLYISSLQEQDPKKYAGLIRGRWSIENQLHWQLDVCFKEDSSQVRKGSGAENLSITRKLALAILARDKTNMSLKRKRKKAARDGSFLLEIIENA